MIALVASALLTLADPAAALVQDLAFDAKKIEPTAEIRVSERGHDAIYRGIPLRKLLVDERLIDADGMEMASLRGLSDAVIVIRGGDGYQAGVSAAAVAMDVKGSRYLLATHVDGKPLGQDQGPAKLIIPDDPRHVRWVHNIDAIALVRMPKLKAPGPAKPGR